MIQQQASGVRFYGWFVESKVGKTGLTVTVDVRKNGTLVVTAGSATEEGGGLYYYDLAGGSVDADGYYTAVFKTATTTVDAQHTPALWVVTGWADKIDATISSRATPADIPSAATVADAVLDEALSGHVASGSAGEALGLIDDIKAKTDTIGSVSVTVTSPVASDGTLTLVQGDDYLSADGTSIDFAFTGLTYTLVGATVKLSLRHRITGTITTVTGTVLGAASCRFEPTATETGALTVGDYDYDIQATLASTAHVRTPLRGRAQVLADYTP